MFGQADTFGGGILVPEPVRVRVRVRARARARVRARVKGYRCSEGHAKLRPPLL